MRFVVFVVGSGGEEGEGLGLETRRRLQELALVVRSEFGCVREFWEEQPNGRCRW